MSDAGKTCALRRFTFLEERKRKRNKKSVMSGMSCDE
jgi:hypothetical protein